MEDLTDADEKRPRHNSYGPPHPSPSHRMPPADPASLHNYHHPQPFPPHHAAPWAPPPSPYESSEQRPSQELPHHQVNPSNSYVTQSREQSVYGPDPSYSRAGSISAPNRSPPDGHPYPHLHQVNGNVHDAPYHSQQGPTDYRSRTGYAPLESPANGSHPPGLHLVTGQEVMSAHPTMPPSASYGLQPSAGPLPNQLYQQPSYDYSTHPMTAYGHAGQRRKPVRAAQACDSCRQRKSKCDEVRPSCSHCRDNNLRCSYRDVPLQKQDKQALALTEKLDAMDDKISKLLDLCEAQRVDLGVHAKQLEVLRGLLPPEKEAQFQAARIEMYNHLDDVPTLNHEASFEIQTNAGQNVAPPQIWEAAAVVENTHKTDEFALPVKHTTAAQNILAWPCIKALIPSGHKDSYVMDSELDRGLLRLYGCGEGGDKNDGGKGPESPADGPDGTRNEDEVSTPSPGGVWGSGQLPPPSPAPGQPSQDHPGGVGANGNLILDSDTIDRYVKSYMENIHILHPFLEERVLRDMVLRFKKRYSKDRLPFQYKAANSSKRKRHADDSPTLKNEINQVYHPHQHQAPAFGVAEVERSVTSAIILLVMALGKICAHKRPLPGPASPSAMPTSVPGTTYSDLPTSAPGSPYVPSGRVDPRGKNMDVIPGLAYYSIAAGIIGELAGGSDLSYVQANILAGLYMGQLARVFPSYHYLTNACRSCQVLLDSSDYKTARPARRDLINFAFWTCLQLESDILAEVELPPSGISRYESKMVSEMPSGTTIDKADGEHVKSDPTVLLYYLSQIQLRRTLNEIHSNLYNKNSSNQAVPNFKLIDILNQNLEGWRKHLPTALKWNDNDHKSANINDARMRAKYYGAKYIIHRPALHYALNLRRGFPISRSGLSESPTAAPGAHLQQTSPIFPNSNSSSFPRPSSEMAPPSRVVDSMDPTLRKVAESCVRAAIRSTTAFDGVPERLIITNIFGTAHAQFGNMLVLAATYNSDLSSLVERGDLLRLFQRTIEFLKYNEEISPTLKYDARILEHIRNHLFPPSHPNSANNSFSSN